MLQKQQNEPECTLEKVVLGLMFWSDSTHLANFGTAKVWPIYLQFANLSKYIRCKPTSGASHHVAYIPSVSITFLVDCSLLIQLYLASRSHTRRYTCGKSAVNDNHTLSTRTDARGVEYVARRPVCYCI
jgi:hypothetical protein